MIFVGWFANGGSSEVLATTVIVELEWLWWSGWHGVR